MNALLGPSLILVMLQVAVPRAAEEKAHPCATLETALPHGVKLLEEKRYKEFFETFVHPDDLPDLPPGQTLDDVAESFGRSDRSAVMLSVFTSIQAERPVLSEDGTVATYKVTVKKAPRDEIRFVRRDGRWYVTN